MRQALSYIRSCGNEKDPPLLEQAARRQISSNIGGAFLAEPILETIYAMRGRASIPAIKSILAAVPSSEAKVELLHTVKDAAVSADLASLVAAGHSEARAEAAVSLAELGEPGGIVPAAGIAQNQQEQLQTRAVGLETFRWFKGPDIEAFVLDDDQGLEAGRG
jgi:hypothetical protein